MSFFDDIESAAKKVGSAVSDAASSAHDALFGSDKKDDTKKDTASHPASSGSTAAAGDQHATQTATRTAATDNTNAGQQANDACGFQTACADIYNLNNLSLFTPSKDTSNANGKLPAFNLSNVDGSVYDDVQSKYFGDQVKNESSLADDSFYTQLAGYAGAKPGDSTSPTPNDSTAASSDATRTGDTQTSRSGGAFDQVGQTAADGTKVFRNAEGNTIKEGPGGVEHHGKKGGDTHVGKNSIDTVDGDTKIHFDKKDHTVDYTDKNGQHFHYTKDGKGDYKDGKGNELQVGQDGKMHFTFHNGDSVTVDAHNVRHHFRHGGPDLISQRRDDDHNAEPRQPDKGTVTSMTNGSGERMLRVADDSGHMYIDVGQKGDRVFNVTDGKGKVTEQIYTWAGSDKFVIKKEGQEDIELHRENGHWVVTKQGPNGEKTAVNVNDLTINGHKLDENSNSLQITNDTSVQSSGTVDTRAAGKDVHVTGSGATAAVQQGQGDTNHITVSGSQTISRQTDAHGNTQTSTDNGQTGSFTEQHAQMQSNGQLGPQQTDAALSGNNQVDMNGNHFGFSQQGDGFRWDTSKLWNGDTVDIWNGIKRACGDAIDWAGDVLFGDGTKVDAYGNVSDGDKSLGQAGDGTWGGGADTGDGSVSAAEGAIAQAAAVADAIRGSISSGVINSSQIGELLSLYSTLGALKGQVLAQNGANLESASVIGNLDSQQASVSGAINEAQVAGAMQEIAKSLSSAGADPEIISALERAGAGGNPAQIQKELEDRGVITNGSVRTASSDQANERNANSPSNNPAAA